MPMKNFKTGRQAQSFLRKIEKSGGNGNVGFEDYRPFVGSKRQRRIWTVRYREIEYLPNRENPRKVKGKSTTLKNMASVTVTKLPNGVVKITGRKMAGRKNVGGVQYVAYEDNRSGGRPFKVARAASFQGRGRIIAGPTTKNIASGAAALANKLERLKRGKR